MDKPMLLIHGEADNNPGTFTLQTERYFQAIKGLGGNARMVILPKESHGYAAKENIFHLLWEQEQFLDKHFSSKTIRLPVQYGLYLIIVRPVNGCTPTCSYQSHSMKTF
jgi:hypothetical protein